MSKRMLSQALAVGPFLLLLFAAWPPERRNKLGVSYSQIFRIFLQAKGIAISSAAMWGFQYGELATRRYKTRGRTLPRKQGDNIYFYQPQKV